MGLVNTFFIQSFSSKRPAVTSGGNEALTTVLTNVPCLVTKKEEEAESISSGYYGKKFVMYTANGLDIKEQDIITSSGVNYAVKGVDKDIPDMFEGTDSFSAYIIVKTNQ